MLTSTPEVAAPVAVYTVSDIARLTQFSERHIWRLIERGKVPGRIHGLGRSVRFSKAAIDSWLAGDSGLRRQEQKLGIANA